MRQDFTPLAMALLVMCCASWGFQQVAVKVALVEMPAAMQASLRSAIAFAILLAYALAARRDLSPGDGTLGPGLLAGALFAVEFAAIFVALTLTDAARVVMLIFVAPFVVALGGRFLPDPEALTARRWAGIAVAFLGLAVLLEPWNAARRANLAGDLLALAGGILWGLTTLVIKATKLRSAEPVKVLLLQLGPSALLLVPISLLLGETWRVPERPITWLALAYSAVWVVALTYLIWFWMLRTYPAAKLSALTFLTPVFGVVFGWLALGERLTPNLGLSVIMVVAGILLVTWPSAARRAAPP
jgi:drug/metabolite transporter (DMT)-like permease